MEQDKIDCINWLEQLEEHGTDIDGAKVAVEECEDSASLQHLETSLSWVVNALNGSL